MEAISNMCWQYVFQNKSIDNANVQLSGIWSQVTEYWNQLQGQKFAKGKKKCLKVLFACLLYCGPSTVKSLNFCLQFYDQEVHHIQMKVKIIF